MLRTKTLFLYSGLLLLFACTNSSDSFDASGTFEATEIIVSSEANGRLVSFNVDEGKNLQAGETVGYVDSVQLFLKKKQLLANRKAVESRRPDIAKQVAAIRQQIATANTEKQRIENLLKANAATQKQLDDINAQIAVLQKQLDAQLSSLEISNKGISDESSVVDVQVAQLDDQLQKCRITSPIKGTVLVKYAEMGEITAAGKPLFKIADTETMTLRAYITAGQLAQVKLGQKLRVFADFGEKSREYEGTVSWISDKSEFTPKTLQTRDERANLVYAVKISVKNDGFLKIGMYGNLQLKIENEK